MKKLTLLTSALLFAVALLAQFPRNKVLLEEGTGTW